MATWTTIPDADLTSGKPGKQSIFRALRDNIDAALSGDPSAPKIQSGAFDDGVITAEKLDNTTVGDYVIKDSTGEVSHVGTTYTKKKEIAIFRAGNARITFSLRASADTAYGRIYKNGVAIGTERTTTSGAYVDFTEDISGLVKGDLIQLYLKNSGTTSTSYSDKFQYKAANPLEAVVIL